MRDGLVVASVGRNFSIAAKSPVSATTVVYFRNCSSRFCGIKPPWDGWGLHPANEKLFVGTRGNSAPRTLILRCACALSVPLVLIHGRGMSCIVGSEVRVVQR